MLLTHEQKSFARAYDHILQCAETALADPGIAATLGETAISLNALLQQTFLPNIHHGKLSLPNSERGTARIAVIPGHRDAQIDSLFDGYPLSWPVSHTYSDFYDIQCAEEVQDILAEHRSRQGGDDNCMLGVSLATARTTSDFVLSRDGTRIFRSRPVIGLRRRATAASLLHELVHAEDTLRDGSFMFSTVLYKAATESRAYQVDTTIDPHSTTSRALERHRRKTADPNRPFAPTPEHIKYLQSMKVI